MASHNKYKTELLLSLTLILFGLNSYIHAESSDTTQSNRSKLSAESLLATKLNDNHPLSNHHYLPANDAVTARHSFSGKIIIPQSAMVSNPQIILPIEINNKQTQLFPAVSFEFFSFNGRLVPVDRGIMVEKEGDSFWQIQASPGKTWSEPNDKEFSRASFPFILTSNIENESYNGVATFIYNDKKISPLRYQIVHQLSPYMVKNRFLAWGKIAVDYQKSDIDNKSKLQDAFTQELKDRLMVKPWSKLTEKYPPQFFANFDSGVAAEKTLSSGLVIDNVIYAKPHLTPYGNYPYPEEMSHGVWSVSKSMMAMMTSLRMAQKYGDEIFDYKIKDYLNVTAEHNGWNDVTFGDALNMATGIGAGSHNVDKNNISDGYLSPVNEKPYLAWYFALTASDKMNHVFQNPNYPWNRNQYVRYRDRDTFTLAVALDALLKEKEGPDANIWQMMVKEVFTPIGIHHLQSNMTKEVNGAPGIPFMGWGLYMTMDHIAKLSTLVQNEGRYQDMQILSKSKLAEALYQTEKRGLLTGRENQYGAKSYHMSLWHTPYKSDEGRTISVAEMHGFGGVLVTLFPNKMIGFRIGNGGYSSLGMIETANKIEPFK